VAGPDVVILSDDFARVERKIVLLGDAVTAKSKGKREGAKDAKFR
jgi:hypothetical protein